MDLKEAVSIVDDIRARAPKVHPPSGEPSGLLANVEALRRKFASCEAQRLEQVEQDQRQQRAYQRYLDLLPRARLPRRHQQMLGRCDLETPWGNRCKWLMLQISTGCLVAAVGGRGTGKTQMGAYAIDAACRIGRSAKYMEAARMFMEIRDSFKPDGSELEAYRKFTAPQLLVIDQLEERKHSAPEDLMLFNIINRRYNDCSDTILLSNETVEDFMASVGESITDRLAQCGAIIECDWPSFRAPASIAEQA